ncbi:MAG TPA: YbjQ family protein [Bacillota bacterium]|nr:YbjQ family protein [Bacillota bacterium]
MLLTTATVLHTDYEVLGIVMGNKVRAQHVGKDILAALRNLVGGEVKEYSELLKKVRQSAMDEMIEEAKKLGANGIIGIQFSSAQIASGMAEIIAYGTAVKI